MKLENCHRTRIKGKRENPFKLILMLKKMEESIG